MSVGVALSASDGMVVFADGRTSHVADREAQSDTTVKLVAAPHDLPFVVVPLGRASVNGTAAADLVTQVLEQLPREDLRMMDLQHVTQHLASALEARDAEWPLEGVGDNGEYLRVVFWLLVAGYSNAQPSGNAECWMTTIPTRGLVPQLSEAPVTVCGQTDLDTLVHDLFDSFNDDLEAGTLGDGQDTYLLRGLSMTQVRERAEGMLRDAATSYPDEMCDAGVGGWWRVAQIGSEGPVRVDSADIGPMVLES